MQKSKYISLEDANKLTNLIKKYLQLYAGTRQINTFKLEAVGAFRRKLEKSKDIDLLITCQEDIDHIQIKENTKIRIKGKISEGTRRSSLIIEYNGQPYQVDFFFAKPDEYPFALFHHTGDKMYNIRTRAYAKKKGYLLNQYGLFHAKTGRRARNTSKIKTEKNLTDYLGITYRPPDNRNENKNLS